MQISLLKDAGAIILAKTNMAEWAFAPDISIGSVYGVVRNPYDLDRSTGGSSGGTAAGESRTRNPSSAQLFSSILTKGCERIDTIVLRLQMQADAELRIWTGLQSDCVQGPLSGRQFKRPA